MLTRTRTLAVLTMGVIAWAGLLLSSADAQAQGKGQIIVTQKEAPDGASKADMKKFLKKNKVAAATKGEGDSWDLHLYAKLRSKPAAKILKLEHNGGKLHLGFYKKEKRKWVMAHRSQIDYTEGSVDMKLPFKVTSEHKLEAGKYEIRIEILNAKKKAQVLAKTSLTLK